MKKSLIALAALAATASFAQSTVTVFGTFDPSLATQKTTYGDNKSYTQNFIRNSSQGTSQVTFKGEEDLGGGLKAMFLLENDFDTRFNANGNPFNGVNGLGALGGEQYLGLAGGFGSVKIGAANTPSLYAQANRNVWGTKIGSGFSGVLGTSHVRTNNSLVYGSPVFAGGFQVGAAYGFKTTADANAKGTYNISTGDTKAVAGLNSLNVAAITDVAISYANGPLAAGVGFWNTDANPATAAGANTSATAAATDRNKQTNVYVQYDFGVAKLFAGMHNERQGTAIDAAGKNIGVQVPLSAQMFLQANVGRLDDKLAADANKKIAGIGVRYNLSNRTSVYARYVDEKNDNVTATGSAKAIRTGLVGMQHNF